MAEQNQPFLERIDLSAYDRTGDELSPRDAMIPWIDNHQHGQTTSWNDRELWNLTGGHGVVFLTVGQHQPYTPVKPRYYRYLWDETIKTAHKVSKHHVIEAYAGVGIHVLKRVNEYEDLLAKMPEYIEAEERVVAIGETGLDHRASGSDVWPIEEQRHILSRQMEIADDTDVPVLCHIPRKEQSAADDHMEKAAHETAVLAKHDATPAEDTSSDRGNPKVEAAEQIIETKDTVGLPDAQVVINHGDLPTAEYITQQTDAYVSFSIGHVATGTDPGIIAEAIDRLGPDQIMVDTDQSANNMVTEMSMKRTIVELLRYGIDSSDIRRCVYENPREVLGLTDLPP